MAITITTEVSILIAIAGIIITIYLAIWSKYGLKEAVSGIRSDTSSIKQSIDLRMRDLTSIVRLLIKQSGNTIEYELKNIGKIKISVVDISELTIYEIESEMQIFKEGFLRTTAKETEEFLALENQLFGKPATAYALMPRIIRLELPSTDKETCNRFVVFYLNWLDSVYWEKFGSVNEWEQSLSEQLEKKP